MKTLKKPEAMEIATTLKEAPRKLEAINRPPETLVYITVTEHPTDQTKWKKALRASRGIWKNRTDLPDFQKLRREFDREF